MTVPLSEAVANRVPSLLRARAESGDLCASTTLMASHLNASYKITCPVEGEDEVPGGACEGGENGVFLLVVVGMGYARKQRSDEGASDTMAGRQHS